MTVGRLRSIILMLFFLGSQLSSHRDPFYLHQKRKQPKNSGRLLRLVGVISYQNTYGAIVATDKNQRVVFTGDVINGYTIKNIFAHGITMARGDKIKKLTIAEVNS